jgi:Pentapeptide repeats (8 copies).
LREADLKEADLEGAEFDDAELTEVRLARSDCESTVFVRANLTSDTREC